MKITKTPEQIKREQAIRDKANEGCHVCPCCGESKTDIEYAMNEHRYDKGISVSTAEEWEERFFNLRVHKIDQYRCKTCGAEWESEPYNYR